MTGAAEAMSTAETIPPAAAISAAITYTQIVRLHNCMMLLILTPIPWLHMKKPALQGCLGCCNLLRLC